MKDLKTLYALLEKYKHFDNDVENCDMFLNTVDEIILEKNPASLPILISYLEDDTNYSWIMESIIISFDRYSVVDHIIFSLPTISNKNICWLTGVFYGIFNSPKDLEVFKHNIHLADQKSLFQLFDYMEKESPHHYDLIQDLRKMRLAHQ